MERAWVLLERLGEGDAGEVFRVESLIEKQPAILKRPRPSAFTSDIIRQAAQIEREARILRHLTALESADTTIGPPLFLDQSKPGSEFSERFFMVISEAKGFNLSYLARSIRFGEAQDQEPSQISQAYLPASERAFLQALIDFGQFPELLLLRILDGVTVYLDAIHQIDFPGGGSNSAGVIWNDIKPDHIFFHPQSRRITLIDWGNGHFLEADGVTSDRQHSRLDDYQQFLDEMGRFLYDAAPDLYHSLDWPQELMPGTVYSEGIAPLKGRIHSMLLSKTRDLEQARRVESEILTTVKPDYAQYTQLQQVQNQIRFLGGTPEYVPANKFAARIAQEMLAAGNLEKFQTFCEQLSADSTLDKRKWGFLARLSALLPGEPGLRSCLHYSLQEDWNTVLWEMRRAALYEPVPAWWDELSSQVRSLELNGNSSVLSPFTAANRLILALQSASRHIPSSHSAARHHSSAEEPPSQSKRSSRPGSPLLHNKLLHSLQEEVLRRWTELEPDPPDSDIGYQEVFRYAQDIEQLAPAAGQVLFRTLDQPVAQVQIVLDAWERMEFETAQRGLKRILMWDPDRRRLMTAERAILATSGWLERMRRGPSKDEALQDFVTRYELEGREIRNQVGPASWLDATLSALRDMRRGGEPADVLVNYPAARPVLGWLMELEPQRPILSAPGKVLRLERNPLPPAAGSSSYGITEMEFGEGRAFQLGDSLDTWAPEAIGSSARVFLGYFKGPEQQMIKTAIKVMRPDRMDYALPLFREEIQVLSLLREVPGVAPMIECGFLDISERNRLPSEEQQLSAIGLSGQVIRYGVDVTHNFLADLPDRLQRGWLPYLALTLQERAHNLLLLCDTGYTRGRFLPVLEGLLMAIQICDILEAAHARNIAYRDHKILHYYWNESANGVSIIDWNIARRFPGGMPPEDARFDLVQFGARALHHILTGRPAAGALPLGPTRPEEIDAASRSYPVRWTYDDQRLPKGIKEILESVMAGEYDRPHQLGEDLRQAYDRLADLAQQEN